MLSFSLNILSERRTYEVDKMFRFAGNKKSKQWVWIAMDTKSRQIIAFFLYSVVKEQIRIY